MKSGWFIPGFAGDSLIAIKVNLLEQDETFSNFYWADEPIGHSITEDELMTKEDAIEQLKALYDEISDDDIYDDDDDDDPIDNLHASLEKWRTRAIDFIKSTWTRNGLENDISINDYPAKEHLTEWFNVDDVLNHRVGYDFDIGDLIIT